MAKRGNPNWIKGGVSPNPSGRASRADAAPAPPVNALGGLARMVMQHFDGYQNAGTGLGIAGKDKTVGTFFCPDVIDAWTAEQIYRGDPIAARIIDMVPDDACSEQPELCIGDYEAPEYYKPEPKALPGTDVMPGKPLRKDAFGAPARPLNSWERRVVSALGRARRDAEAADSKSLSEEICNHLGRGQLDAMGAIAQAIKYRDTGGGSAILLGANDYTTDLRQPLDLTKVRSLDYLTVLESRELVPLYFYNDPFAPKFNQAAVYQLVPWRKGAAIAADIPPGAVQIHESRLIVFDAPKVSERQLNGAMPGWGDSKFTRIGAALKSYASAIQNIDVLLADFAQAVYKIKGLASALLTNPNALTDAMMGIEICRSICRAVIIDEGEEFERKSTSMTGYPELIDRLGLNVTVASGIPHTRLFGTSAKGMNATGEGDDRFYFGGVSKLQTHVVAPAYLRLVEIEMALRGLNPADVTHSVAFKPLWQPTEKELAETRLTIAQADHIYITDDVVSREEIALSRFGGDGWSMETHLDIEARAQQMAVLPPTVDANPQPDPVPPPAHRERE